MNEKKSRLITTQTTAFIGIDLELPHNVCLPVSGTCDEHSATFGSLSPRCVFGGGPMTNRQIPLLFHLRQLQLWNKSG